LLGFIKTTGNCNPTFLYGIKPAIIAIILGAIFPLAKKSKNSSIRDYRCIVLLLALLQFNEIILLLCRILSFILEFIDQQNSTTKGTVDSADAFPVSKTALLAPTNFNLFLIFLKREQSSTEAVMCF
jgi:chromate transporter